MQSCVFETPVSKIEENYLRVLDNWAGGFFVNNEKIINAIEICYIHVICIFAHVHYCVIIIIISMKARIKYKVFLFSFSTKILFYQTF